MIVCHQLDFERWASRIENPKRSVLSDIGKYRLILWNYNRKFNNVEFDLPRILRYQSHSSFVSNIAQKAKLHSHQKMVNFWCHFLTHSHFSFTHGSSSSNCLSEIDIPGWQRYPWHYRMPQYTIIPEIPPPWLEIWRNLTDLPITFRFLHGMTPEITPLMS